MVTEVVRVGDRDRVVPGRELVSGEGAVAPVVPVATCARNIFADTSALQIESAGFVIEDSNSDVARSRSRGTDYIRRSYQALG